MDLWTLMRTADRATVPRVRASPPPRDPGLVLVLMTSPDVRIHHDGYSSSRAGGDFSLLHDDLIERMQVNSDARFVGDYVTSSSFAKSADLWRYEYLSTLLEVVLDDQNRVLALPAASEAEGSRFVFDDQNARTLLPLDQSLVHLRLLGGGGPPTRWRCRRTAPCATRSSSCPPPRDATSGPSCARAGWPEAASPSTSSTGTRRASASAARSCASKP